MRVVFSAFALYALAVVLLTRQGRYGNYLSPFYSPPLGQWLGIPVAPAVLVAWVPLFFRGTCYYYRREYYRAFGAHPPACALGEPAGRAYGGERGWWGALVSSHRWWWALATVVLVFLWRDTASAFVFGGHLGVGLGSALMLFNVVLLTAYTLSCHAFRHLVGGRLDCLGCRGNPAGGTGALRRRLYAAVSWLNRYHGPLAWASMLTVWGVDVYIRLLQAGLLIDPRWVA